MMLKLMRQNH